MTSLRVTSSYSLSKWIQFIIPTITRSATTGSRLFVLIPQRAIGCNAIHAANSVAADLAINISGGTLTAPRNVLWIGSGLTSFTLNISGGMIISGGDEQDNGGAGWIAPTAAEVEITGGVMMVGSKASVFMSFGSTDATKIKLPGSLAGSTTFPVDTTAATVTYNDAQKYMWSYSGETNAALAGAMKNGAQLRMVDGSNGLRFVTEFSADVVSALEALGDVQYGTLIVPLDYLASTKGVFTHAALAAAGLTVADIVANNGLFEAADGSVTIRAALTNIKAENYGRAFAAVAYAKVDGTYYYGEFDSVVNSRAATQVSLKALADVQESVGTVGGILYSHACVVEGYEGYSRYNAAQQAVLAAYVGKALKAAQ